MRLVSGISQLVEYLPSMYSLGLDPQSCINCKCACNLSTKNVEVGGSKVQGHP